MKIQISKATFDRMDEFNVTLNDAFVLRAIKLMQRSECRSKVKDNSREDMFNKLEWTRPMKESTINGVYVSELIFKRYNKTRISWNLVLGEVVGMSIKNGNDRNGIEKVFGIEFEDGDHDKRTYIKELDASLSTQNSPNCGRIMAKGGKNLPFSVHIKFKRRRGSKYGIRGDTGDFKINIDGGGCEIS